MGLFVNLFMDFFKAFFEEMQQHLNCLSAVCDMCTSACVCVSVAVVVKVKVSDSSQN